MRKSVSAIFLVLACALCLGCQSTPYVGKLTPCDDEPDWVSRGPGEFAEGEGKVIVAVGVASHEPNLALKRNRALRDARAELAKQLDVYATGMSRSLGRSHAGYFDKDRAGSTEFFQAASRSVVEACCKGIKDAAWWNCAVTDQMFVLVRVPEEQFLNRCRESVAEQARAREGELFKGKTEEALGKLAEELDTFLLRPARGYLAGK